LAEDPGRELELLQHLRGESRREPAARKASREMPGGQSLSWQRLAAFRG